MKKQNIKYILLLLLFFVITCDEKNEVIVKPNAKLIWTGSYDNGGCGFFIEADSILYKPENEGIISPSFKVSRNLSVAIQFIDLFYKIETNCQIDSIPQKANAIKLTYMDLNEELNWY